MRAVARAGLLAVTVWATACGPEPKGVPVGEAAEPVVVPTRPRRAPLDTVYADSGLYADPSLDSLHADTTAAEAPALPAFEPFWVQFQTAVRQRTPEADALGRFAADGPFREGLLGLTARDVRRIGTAREAVVRVGYDAAGAVVPQDEADRDSTLTLRFEVVDGAYRLVDVDVRG